MRERRKRKKTHHVREKERENSVQKKKKKSEKVGLTSVERKNLIFSNRIWGSQAEN